MVPLLALLWRLKWEIVATIRPSFLAIAVFRWDLGENGDVWSTLSSKELLPSLFSFSCDLHYETVSHVSVVLRYVEYCLHLP